MGLNDNTGRCPQGEKSIVFPAFPEKVNNHVLTTCFTQETRLMVDFSDEALEKFKKRLFEVKTYSDLMVKNGTIKGLQNPHLSSYWNQK